MACRLLSAEKQGDVSGAAPSRGDSAGDPRDLAEYAVCEPGRLAGKEHDVAPSAERPSPAVGVSMIGTAERLALVGSAVEIVPERYANPLFETAIPAEGVWSALGV